MGKSFIENVHDIIPMTKKLSARSSFPDLITLYFLIFWTLLPFYFLYTCRFFKVNKRFIALIKKRKVFNIFACLSVPLMVWVFYVQVGSGAEGTSVYRTEVIIANNRVALAAFSSMLFFALNLFINVALRIVQVFYMLIVDRGLKAE